MKYLTNDRNIVRAAVLSALNIVPSNVIYRIDQDAKVGGGLVTVTGDYVGAADSIIDIKIVDTTISGAPKISAPVFNGIGNGTLTDASADSSIVAQKLTVTLEDLGTATLSAYAPFQGFTLRAKASGSSGNDIAIVVDNSAIALAETSYSIQHDLTAGTNEYTGDEWDFGAAILAADKTIPDSAPRITFGADPQVYRQYKFYRTGQYVYGFSPAPVRDVPKGTVVNAVTGTRAITITDAGVDVGVMTDLVTLYDALSAIRDDSTLVEVVGAIVNDKTPGGQGATDLSVWTAPYVTGILAQGSDAVVHADLIVSPNHSAPTETLKIICTDASAVGGELWSVRGDVSGPLDPAETGVPYQNGAYSFTIPLPANGSTHPQGSILVEYIPESARDSLPNFCPTDVIIGAAGRAGSWEFVYTKRPAPDCDCSTGEISGSPSEACLGVDIGGSIMGLDDLHRGRQIFVDRWFRNLTGSVFRLTTTKLNDTQTYQSLDAYKGGLSAATGARNVVRDALDAIFLGVAEAPPANWQPNAVHSLGDIILPAVRTGYLMRVSVAGTTGSSEPTWPTSFGAIVTDGSVTWEAFSLDAIAAFDEAFDEVKTKIAPFALPNLRPWSTTVDWGAHGSWPTLVVPTTPNGHFYGVAATGTSSGTEPTWPTTGGTVSEGEIVWQDLGRYWFASTRVAQGDIILGASAGLFEAVNSGTTGSSEPDWNELIVTDGGVTWKRVTTGFFHQQVDTPDEADDVGIVADQAGPRQPFFDGLKALFSEAFSIGGAKANFNSAGVKGDGCWQDFEQDHWWVYNGTDAAYLPVQTGHYYTSEILVSNNQGDQVAKSTKEFGFGPKFACADRLVEGDTIRITINTGTNTHGYQEADEFDVSVNHALPVPLGGGQTGNDTLTWSVFGSVAGRKPDYALVTTALAPYDYSGHLGFQITPGGIPFALGDIFEFAIEGGHFESRRDGGSWSSATAIADSVTLTDGLVVNFAGGTAPSWVDNDQWSFKAEAVNGVDGIRQPTDRRMQWHDSTAIVIDAGATDSITGLFIGDHTIPSNAVITLLGSDDSFVSTPYSQVIPWKATHIYFPLVATRAKYKLTIDKGGSMQWLWLGNPLVLAIRTGLQEIGLLTKRWRMPGLSSRLALGAQVSHSALSQATINDLLAALSYACVYDDQRIGIVPNDFEDEASIVLYSTDTLELTDELSFQPTDTANRLTSVTLQLEPAP